MTQLLLSTFISRSRKSSGPLTARNSLPSRTGEVLLLHAGPLDSPYDRVVLNLHAIWENLARQIAGQVSVFLLGLEALNSGGVGIQKIFPHTLLNSWQ